MSDVRLTVAWYAVCEGRATVLEALDWLPAELRAGLIDNLFEARRSYEEVLMLEELLAQEER
jgi:hypothetical protein